MAESIPATPITKPDTIPSIPLQPSTPSGDKVPSIPMQPAKPTGQPMCCSLLTNIAKLFRYKCYYKCIDLMDQRDIITKVEEVIDAQMALINQLADSNVVMCNFDKNGAYMDIIMRNKTLLTAMKTAFNMRLALENKNPYSCNSDVEFYDDAPRYDCKNPLSCAPGCTCSCCSNNGMDKNDSWDCGKYPEKPEINFPTPLPDMKPVPDEVEPSEKPDPTPGDGDNGDGSENPPEPTPGTPGIDLGEEELDP